MAQRIIRVLLIEDDPVAAGVLEAQLSADFGTRYEAELVESLADALRRLEDDRFDAIVLDLLLPDARGLEALGRVMDAAEHLPIVVLTSLDDEEVALKALQQGAQDYVVKGEIHGRLMARSIRYAIERHRMTEALRGLALVDEVTGLYNRRGFGALAEHQINATRRLRRGAALISAQIAAGVDDDPLADPAIEARALCQVADILRATFRSSDLLARVGPRELLVLASQPDRDGADAAVARLEGNLAPSGVAGLELQVRIGLDWMEVDELSSGEAVLERYESPDGPTVELHCTGSVVLDA